MKKLFLTVSALMVAFAILLPFASTTPDGLETLTKNVEQQEPVWSGFVANYSVALSNQFVSTLVAGLFGTGMVLVAGFAFGAVASHRKKSQCEGNRQILSRE